MSAWTPHGYQIPLIKQATQSLLAHSIALIVMATGTGKTPVSAFTVKEIIKTIPAPRVLFLAHMEELLKQGLRNFKGVFNSEFSYGLYYGKEKVGDANFTFATFQTMKNSLSVFPPDYFEVVVVDESHHAQAVSFKEVLDYFKPKYLLGMTATPDRTDDTDICDIFGEPVVNLGLAEAIGKGYLTPVDYRIVTDGIDNDALERITREVTQEGARYTINEINSLVFIKARDEKSAELILREKKKAIIFCRSIEHATRFSQYLRDAEVYHSSNSAAHNEWVMDGFRKGVVQHILVVDMFNEGVDVPDTEMLVFLRGTESKRIFLQQLGRGLRVSEGKTSILVLDFVANIERLRDVDGLAREITKYQNDDRVTNNEDKRPKHLVTVSGLGFSFNFSQVAIDLLSMADKVSQPFYTYQEACVRVRELGIKSPLEYKKQYKEDLRLPSAPHIIYANKGWVSWTVFFGGKEKDFYTYEEACARVRELGIKSRSEYKKQYKQDLKLPSTPDEVYANKGWVSSTVFFGGEEKDFYTYQEACARVRELGIKSQSQYYIRYKEDSRLPSAPDKIYLDKGWVSWTVFFGKK